MTTVRKTPAGSTRTCPHCRAVILQSTMVCPSCRKHVRFAAGAKGGGENAPSFNALKVEGSVRHPNIGEAWEYAAVITITNDRGEEISRQIVGVGAIEPGAVRKFSFSVEVFAPENAIESVLAGRSD